METDQGYRRNHIHRRLRGDIDGARQPAHPEGDRYRYQAVTELDVETSVPNDFFAQMRTVFSLQKKDVWDRRLAGDKNPPKFLTVREVLEFATIEGARANGLDRKIGTLTPGKDADIILLRTDRLNVMPMNNAVGAMVTSMNSGNVDTVLIAGKVMKRNGQLVGVDLDQLAKLGNTARDRLYANAKVKNTRV